MAVRGMTETHKRGGARVGAGRPKVAESDRAKARTIRLADADYALFMILGGVKWLRVKLHTQVALQGVQQ